MYYFSSFLAATKQLYEWLSPSVRPSIRPSVRLSGTPFSLCSCHHIIMKFSEVITIDRSDVHAKGQGQRSKVKVTEVMTPLRRFRTVTPVWIHTWQWNDAQSLMLLRRGALLFFKVIHQIAKSHGEKIIYFDPNWGFPDCNSSWLWNDAQSLTHYGRGALIFFWVIHQNTRLHGQKIDDLIPILSKITRLVAAIKSLRFALFPIWMN